MTKNHFSNHIQKKGKANYPFVIFLTLFILSGCNRKMATYLGRNPQSDSNYNGCLGASGKSITSQIGLTTVRKWTETKEQAEMLDNFISIGAQYVLAKFEISPNVAYYNDGASPNAFASKNGKGDGVIRIGGSLVQQEFKLWRTGFFEQCSRSGKDPYQLLNNKKAGGCYSVTAIIAHEAAHILQAKMGVAFNSRNTELQADFLAGWHIAAYERIFSSEFKEFRMKEDGIRAFYSRGDYSFNSPQHHGTPEQRSKAFLAGFALGDVSLLAAWNKSMEYRRKLGG
jgi:hypothetical protein